jgi:hypothetical protein
MIEVIVEFEVDDRPTTPEEVEDEYLAEMLHYTGEQIQEDVQRKIGDMTCDEHGGHPRVTVTSTYSTDTEQMELSYHVDTCCQQMLLRTVQALNH